MTERTASAKPPAARLWLACAALLWERLWPACWPACAVLSAFFILALSGLLPRLPGLVHGALLLALGAGLVLALGAAFRQVVIPDRGTARRRIEQASGLRH